MRLWRTLSFTIKATEFCLHLTSTPVANTEHHQRILLKKIKENRLATTKCEDGRNIRNKNKQTLHLPHPSNRKIPTQQAICYVRASHSPKKDEFQIERRLVFCDTFPTIRFLRTMNFKLHSCWPSKTENIKTMLISKMLTENYGKLYKRSSR